MTDPAELIASLTPPARMNDGQYLEVRASILREAVALLAALTPPEPTQVASADAEKLVDNLIVEARGYERLADVYNDELLRDARAAVLSAMRGTTVPVKTLQRLFDAACKLVNQADDPPRKYPGTDIDMLDAPKWAFEEVGNMLDAIGAECPWLVKAAAAPETAR